MQLKIDVPLCWCTNTQTAHYIHNTGHDLHAHMQWCSKAIKYTYKALQKLSVDAFGPCQGN